MMKMKVSMLSMHEYMSSEYCMVRLHALYSLQVHLLLIAPENVKSSDRHD